MTTFPLPLDAIFLKIGVYAIYLVIGFGFGFALESSGFNKSTKLAGQFYFKDLTVFKVFFTAIVIAMLLIFGATALGLLDYNLIFVNPTYLWSGILGGFIMGIGFIIGGFCPGTSLVAVATLKIDGIFFVVGGLVGAFAFSESVDKLSQFFNGSYFGRVTLMDVFDLPTGVVALLVTLMALFMFWGGEKLEDIYGGKDSSKAPKARYIGAGVAVLFAVALIAVGQPTNADRWERIAIERQAQLDNREVQIESLELLHYMHDSKINLVMLDVREEKDYNLFHITDADHLSYEEIPEQIDPLLALPANTLFVVMSNDEELATEAWKYMVAESVPNVYILENGVNGWISNFADEHDEEYITAEKEAHDPDEFRYLLSSASGNKLAAAYPHYEEYKDLKYTPKVKMEIKAGPSSGGCG
ncbi:MAG: YeeE/YedE family protein [Chloroflexi bacterium]|nr:YeeE/YedE family protein [Chloroflexota bacterium]